MTADQGGSELSRREALRRGALAGLGLVWAPPAIQQLTLRAESAQVTSPVPEDTTPTTEGEGGGQTTTTTTTTQPSGGGPTPQVNEPPTDVGGISIQQPNPTPQEVAAEQITADELPFTGLPADQLLPLAGGMLASGAAALHMAREKKVGRHQADGEAEGSEA